MVEQNNQNDLGNQVYYEKYLKYKRKYLELQVAGGLFDTLKALNGYYLIFHKNVD